MNPAYRVVTHNTLSPIDLAQMAHTWRDAIYPSKSMAKHLRKMRLATSLCEPVMHHVRTCVRQPDRHGMNDVVAPPEALYADTAFPLNRWYVAVPAHGFVLRKQRPGCRLARSLLPPRVAAVVRHRRRAGTALRLPRPAVRSIRQVRRDSGAGLHSFQSLRAGLHAARTRPDLVGLGGNGCWQLACG